MSDAESDEDDEVEEDHVWPAPLTMREIMDEAYVKLSSLKCELEVLTVETASDSDTRGRRMAVLTEKIVAYEAKLCEFEAAVACADA